MAGSPQPEIWVLGWGSSRAPEIRPNSLGKLSWGREDFQEAVCRRKIQRLRGFNMRFAE